MVKRLKSLIEKYWKTIVVAILAFAIILIVVKWLILPGYSLAWTGFGDFTKPDSNYVPGKTLWDWMQLFIIPIFLSIGVFLLNRSEREGERRRAEQHANLEREIATDRQQEAALQSYLDRIADLLLGGKIRKQKNAQDVARIRTLTVIRGLDKKRKGFILLFLQEAGLISARQPIINLAGANLRGAKLAGITLEGINLSNISFSDADLAESNLRKSNLSESDFTRANLYDADLSDTDLSDSFMSYANLQDAYLVNADLHSTDLTSANLSGAELQGANLFEALLVKANLSKASLKESILNYVDLTEAVITEADLSGANLFGTNLAKADLTRAKLREVQIPRNREIEEMTGEPILTNLSEAILIGADLTGVNLEGADLTDADLTGAKVTDEQLAISFSLKGTIMPDGRKHK